MKKKISLALLLASIASTVFAYSYNTGVPLPGKTIASEKLQQESLFSVYAFAHRIAPANCTSFSILDTNVSKQKVNNKWQEIWTIQTCSKTAYVPINFELKGDTNIYAIDPMGVKYAK
ncbi:MAG: hypothetical protein MJ230_02995 [bacterium]|nr:hypothetical protein [bacterium]